MRYQTILLAVDLGAGSAPLIDYAFAFAEKAGAKLHVLYACPGAIGPEDARDVQARAAAQQGLEAAVAAHRASPSMGRCLVEEEEPVEAILRGAVSVSADLIILGTHARQGVKGWALGSVAEGVLDEARVPVLVLRAPSTQPAPHPT